MVQNRFMLQNVFGFTCAVFNQMIHFKTYLCACMYCMCVYMCVVIWAINHTYIQVVLAKSCDEVNKHPHYHHYCTLFLHQLTSSANTNSHSTEMSRFTSLSVFSCWLCVIFCQRICLPLSGLFNPLHCFWHQNM